MGNSCSGSPGAERCTKEAPQRHKWAASARPAADGDEAARAAGEGGSREGGRGRGGGKGKGRGKGGKGKGKGKGGAKGGAKVVVEPHRHEGVFIARGKEDVIVTLNSTPGKDASRGKAH